MSLELKALVGVFFCLFRYRRRTHREWLIFFSPGFFFDLNFWMNDFNQENFEFSTKWTFRQQKRKENVVLCALFNVHFALISLQTNLDTYRTWTLFHILRTLTHLLFDRRSIYWLYFLVHIRIYVKQMRSQSVEMRSWNADVWMVCLWCFHFCFDSPISKTRCDEHTNNEHSPHMCGSLRFDYSFDV